MRVVGASLAFTAVLVMVPEPTDESEFVFEEAAILIICFLLNQLLEFSLTPSNVILGIIGA